MTGLFRITASAAVSEYDLLMLKLLYCPAIEPGMDKYAAALALVKHDECFGDYFKKGK